MQQKEDFVLQVVVSLKKKKSKISRFYSCVTQVKDICRCISVSSFIAVKETSRIPSVFCWLLPDISEPSEEEEEFLKDKK